MSIRNEQLEPTPTLLIGFARDKDILEGSIILLVTIGNPPKQTATIARFLIVSYLSVYNVILGRPSLNVIKAVVSTYNLAMKFPTKEGARVVHGDRYESRMCYAMAVKGKQKEAIHIIEGADSDKTAKPKSEKGFNNSCKKNVMREILDYLENL